MRLSSDIAKKLSPAVFILMLAMAVSGAAQEGDRNLTKTVVVMGTGIVLKNDSASAREMAVTNALSAAIDAVTLDLLQPTTFINNFKALNDIFYEQPGNFIKNYKVLAEYASANKYKVMVEATVLLNMLEEQLSQAGIMTDKKPLPKILLLVSEKNLDDPHPRYWWREQSEQVQSTTERTLAEFLSSKGFPIIDHKTAKSGMETHVFFDKPELSDQEALMLGASFQADVVIVGQSMAFKIPNVIGDTIRSFQGNVSVRALRIDSTAEIATTTQSTVVAGSDPVTQSRNALAGAAVLAAKELASQIAAMWQKEDEPPSMIEIALDNTGNLVNFVKFRAILKKVPGVKSIQVKELKSNQAIIMVDFEGNAKELADALILKSFETVGINIYEVSENHLKIALTPG